MLKLNNTLTALPTTTTTLPPPPTTSEFLTPIDLSNDRFPTCIVWTPIPILTWLCPIIGHMGIADSKGIIHDFAGPYYISHDDFAFGRPTRYIQLNPNHYNNKQCQQNGLSTSLSTTGIWDEALLKANSIYEGKMHNICCQNCHSHVATHLDLIGFSNFSRWNMVILAFWMFFCGRFVSFGRALYSLGPSIIFYGLIIYFFCT
jgi:hypothetical protein